MPAEASWTSSQIPLLCLPHAGAGRLYYNKWRNSFGDGIGFEVVQYPARENRLAHPMPETVEELADDIHAEYADLLAGPHAIWGHSMGSVVGYEVVRASRRRGGAGPLVFFSSGSAAPCESRFKRAASLETADGFRDVLLRYGGIPAASLDDPQFMDYFAPIIKTDLRLLGGYREDGVQPLGCPLVLMQGRDDPVKVDTWTRYVERPPEMHLFPGGHFFPAQNQASLVALMSTRIHLAAQLASGRGTTANSRG